MLREECWRLNSLVKEGSQTRVNIESLDCLLNRLRLVSLEMPEDSLRIRGSTVVKASKLRLSLPSPSSRKPVKFIPYLDFPDDVQQLLSLEGDLK